MKACCILEGHTADRRYLVGIECLGGKALASEDFFLAGGD